MQDRVGSQMLAQSRLCIYNPYNQQSMIREARMKKQAVETVDFLKENGCPAWLGPILSAVRQPALVSVPAMQQVMKAHPRCGQLYGFLSSPSS
jgi:hypothetical protein